MRKKYEKSAESRYSSPSAASGTLSNDLKLYISLVNHAKNRKNQKLNFNSAALGV